ncbi:putative Ig domain-containing protein [Agromyces sp. S2-1-8]|uniref:putative Ig domain-containing protein n=1 Tax=Agromyces sp. S2-1-8 TaxID=2897180 RepID=UPI001E4F954F|nr:putative Ig domain-containing protein [Agromyces sp. S2-1-8]MCD5348391.1 putative Ig domain-containing protein [Agromyces sp. S2-1-8]
MSSSSSRFKRKSARIGSAIALSLVFTGAVEQPAQAATSYTVVAEISTGGGSSTMTLDATHGRLYAAVPQQNHVAVIDVSTNDIIGRIPTQSTPHGVTVDEARNIVWVANLGAETVTAYDAATFDELASIPVSMAQYIRYDEGADHVFVSGQFESDVTVIDAGTYAVLAPITFGPTLPTSWQLETNPARGELYVGNHDFQSSISIVDTATSTVLKNVPLPEAPTGISADPESSKVYVALENSVAIIDPEAGAIVDTLEGFALPFDVEVDSQRDRLFVSGLYGQLEVIDTVTGELVQSVNSVENPWKLAINPADGDVFAAAADALAPKDPIYRVSLLTLPEITSAAPDAGVTGSAYSHTVTATGTGPLEYSISDGALPDGLTLDTKTGTISGTPTTIGEYSFTVTVTGPGGTASATYDVPVYAPPVITSPAPEAGILGEDYEHAITVTGTGPFEYAVTAGTLPAGLSLDPETGIISGTPTTIGSSHFSVTVTGRAGTVTKEYDLEVVGAPTVETPNEAPSEAAGLAHTGVDLMTGSAAALAAIAAGLIAFLVTRRRKVAE